MCLFKSLLTPVSVPQSRVLRVTALHVLDVSLLHYTPHQKDGSPGLEGLPESDSPPFI